MLLLELADQLVTVGAVEVNKCGLRLAPVHLTETPAGGLQHHVLGAVTLLRENNAG